MSEELKPCPFCGKDAETDGGLAWCSDVGNCSLEDINMDIHQWNNRPLEDALTDERDALKAKLEQAKETLKWYASWHNYYNHGDEYAVIKAEQTLQKLEEN